MKLLNILVALSVGWMVLACKPTIPSKFLQPDEMAKILYDYHLAEGIASNVKAGDTIALRSYRSGILAKYGVTEAEFDSSMVYYERHTKLLEDVYQKITDRLNAENTALGGSVIGIDDNLSANSDTANVWKSSPCFILSPYVAVNSYSFEIKADTSFYSGDRFLLDFETQFIYQDGMRDARALLAVTYTNDSTEYTTCMLSSSSRYHLQIDNAGRLGIKSVRGFWILNNGTSSDFTSSSTLRLLVVSKIRLVKMHTKEQPVPSQQESGVDSAKVMAIDSIDKRRLSIREGVRK